MAQNYRNQSNDNHPERGRGGRYQTSGDRDRYRTGGEQRFLPERDDDFSPESGGFEGEHSYSQGGYSEEFGYRRGPNREDYDDRAFGGRNYRTRGSSGANYQSGRSYGGDYDREGQSRYDEGRFDEGNRFRQGADDRDYGARDRDTEFALARGRGTTTSRWREDANDGGGYFDTGNYIDDGGASRGFGRDFERARARVRQEYDMGGRGPSRETGGDYIGSHYGSQSNYGRGQDAGAPWGREQQGNYEGRSSWDYGSSRSSQSFRGRGPQGYRRSDERLKEMICERLTDDPTIDASNVTVEVKDQIVKVTGTVDDRSTKYEIEELIERCGGVSDIDNQLRVQSSRWGTSGQQARGGSDWEAGSSSTSASSTSGRSDTRSTSGTTASGTSTSSSPNTPQGSGRRN